MNSYLIMMPYLHILFGLVIILKIKKAKEFSK